MQFSAQILFTQVLDTPPVQTSGSSGKQSLFLQNQRGRGRKKRGKGKGRGVKKRERGRGRKRGRKKRAREREGGREPRIQSPMSISLRLQGFTPREDTQYPQRSLLPRNLYYKNILQAKKFKLQLYTKTGPVSLPAVLK